MQLIGNPLKQIIKMEKYHFLLKPIFFIFSLLFATWLVVKIEKISPSDFGKYESYVSQEPCKPDNLPANKQYLKNLCSDYKKGIIDNILLEQKLTFFLDSLKKDSKK